ncbi:ThuA domain-containing protein [Sphingomonas silueang]|uniref:ThuA domain-containing protein n=1 Tax=Sphingomonas silueang TaxID=3156617 RepID=UPI003CCE5369
MHRLPRAACHALLSLLFVAMPAAAQEAKPDRVLLFHRATGFVHDSIPAAVAALSTIAREQGLEPVASDDPALFDRPLDRFAAIVLVSTTTDRKKPDSEWFVGPRRAALTGFVERGGGLVAIHAAADSHAGWSDYAALIGGRFARHPEGTPTGQVTRTAVPHPATAPLPRQFAIADEWYWFDDLSPALTHLLTLDPRSIGANEVNPRPLAWAHRVGAGRVFYTGLGHRKESWADARVLAHVAGGLGWASGRAKGPPMVVVTDDATRIRQPTPHGAIGMSTAWRITDTVPGRTMEFRRRTLDKGAAIGLHPIDHDEVYHVVSGEGDVTSDGTTRRVGPGQTVYLYSGASVGIAQRGREPLALVISYPLAQAAD